MMTLSSAHAASDDRRVRPLGAAGLGLLRDGLVLLRVMSGRHTCLAFTAEGHVSCHPCGKTAASRHGGDRS